MNKQLISSVIFLKTNFGGILTETTTAQVQLIVTNHSVRITTAAASADVSLSMMFCEGRVTHPKEKIRKLFSIFNYLLCFLVQTIKHGILFFETQEMDYGDDEDYDFDIDQCYTDSAPARKSKQPAKKS